jgi:hypothetical protein
VARYRHAQLSAIKLAGDINAKNFDDATLHELLEHIEVQCEAGLLTGLDVEKLMPVAVNGRPAAEVHRECAPVGATEYRRHADSSNLKPRAPPS